jgi:hypothetical protein
MFVRRCAAAGLVAAALAAAGVAQASPTPPSAPSEYVEVVPTAGGGVAAGSRSRAASPTESSRSAVGAAADAIGSGDEWVIGLGAVLALATLSLVAASAPRRRRLRTHEPKGW